LEKIQDVVNNYKDKYKRLPKNMNEIRVFSIASGRSVSPYDGYGNRIFYQPVSKYHYLIKSFGADGEPNTLNSSEIDISLSNLVDSPSFPPLYQNSLNAQMHLYPSVCTMGCKSATKPFYAFLSVEPVTGSRYLIVRNINKRNFFLVASHPKIDEFLWLPGGEEIIYTVTDDNKYRDGIYLWNLKKDETRNLLDDMDPLKLGISNDNDQKYFLSLSSIVAGTRKVQVFITKRTSNVLHPSEFFSKKSFYSVVVPEKNAQRTIFNQPKDLLYVTAFQQQNPLDLDIGKPFHGFPAQHKWVMLPITGDMQNILESWQDFSMKNASTPLFPYGLWWLGAIYAEASKVTMPVSFKHGVMLKAFGMELLRALASLDTAPSHLRAMATYMHQQLSSSRFFDFPLVKVNPPKKSDLSGF
jgi:hypothetical protein